jgi:hypothetical protein
MRDPTVRYESGKLIEGRNLIIPSAYLCVACKHSLCGSVVLAFDQSNELRRYLDSSRFRGISDQSDREERNG